MSKKIVPAILLLIVSTVLGGTVFREQVAEAATATLNVFVTNDSTNPIPVREQNADPSGNIKVHEQGTASVNVTNSSIPVTGTVTVGNFPATQQVVGTVGINGAANGVQEVNSVANHPFSQVGFATFGAGNPGAFNATVDLFTVPAGERVVITYVAFEVDVPTSEHAVASLTTFCCYGPPLAWIPLTDSGSFNVSYANEFLVGGGLVSVTFSPGQHIIAHAFRSQGDGDNIGQFFASVTGYVVPIG